MGMHRYLHLYYSHPSELLSYNYRLNLTNRDKKTNKQGTESISQLKKPPVLVVKYCPICQMYKEDILSKYMKQITMLAEIYILKFNILRHSSWYNLFHCIENVISILFKFSSRELQGKRTMQPERRKLIFFLYNATMQLKVAGLHGYMASARLVFYKQLNYPY